MFFLLLLKLLEMVWTAPELLRTNNFIGSKNGDIFSFAIICAEVINMKPIFDLFDLKDNAESNIFFSKINNYVNKILEIVYMYKSSNRDNRPKLDPAAYDLSPALVNFI